MNRWKRTKLVFGLAAMLASKLASAAPGVPAATPTSAAAKAMVDKPAPKESCFTVLCYHRFVERPETVRKPLSQYRLPMEEFRWQMQYLKDQGITPISMDQLKAYWFEGTPLPDKAVLLTFDDGFRSIHEKAYPAIKEFGYPGVLFLYSDFIRGQSDSMRYTDIEEMQKKGFDLESHTKSHLNLGLEAEKRKPADFSELLNTELNDPIEFIREKFGVRSDVIAYSYGVYNQEVLEKTKAAGYKLAFTVNPGPNDHTIPPLQLKRNLILYPINHEAFKRIFKDKVLHVKNFKPGDGEVIWDNTPVLSGEILDDIVPKTLDFHLGDHKLVFSYDKKKHQLRHHIGAALKAGGHMLTLSATDKKGQSRVCSWYFRVKHRHLHSKTEEDTITPPAVLPKFKKGNSKKDPPAQTDIGIQDAKETGI